MGGGDLNSKKSWHPNTIKNQERVWKAEQAAADEKRKISELQRERAEERDRMELNELSKRTASGGSGDDRLNWMYDKPNKKVHDEDYLLGKSIEKNYGQGETDEQNVIPAVARRVVGASMISTGSGDTQVDLARKIREDPLLLVKERERAARAALLNNPLQRKKLADLLRKEQDQKKDKPKKKTKKKSKDLDDMLAAKLTTLSGDKGIDISKLLASDDSSSDSDDSSDKGKKKKKSKKEVKHKKKSKKKKKPKKESSDSEDSSSNDHINEKNSMRSRASHNPKNISIRRRSESDSSETKSNYKQKKTPYKSRDQEDISLKESHPHRYWSNNISESNDHKEKRGRSRSPVNKHYEKERRVNTERHRGREFSEKEKITDAQYKSKEQKEKRDRSRSPIHKQFEYGREKTDSVDQRQKRKGLSEEEKAARLAEMSAAGADRERQRGARVAEHRRRDAAPPAPRAHPPAAPALPDSLEKRIQSNRHYIQRNKHHMNEHFARR